MTASDNSQLPNDLFVGICNLDLDDRVIHFPKGIRLEKTFAHIMSPVTVAFARPSAPDKHHPGPWKTARGGFGQDVTAQLIIPVSAGSNEFERRNIAWVIIFLLRLWSDPAITAPALCNMSFSAIAQAKDAEAIIATLEHRPRRFQLDLVDSTKTLESLSWVADNFERTLALMNGSTEFRFAADALSSGQFIENDALILVSLWAALEAIFSPSTSELRFRVSALIAAFLYPAGRERAENQRRIAQLYDKRSAAAHGKPNHLSDHLLETFVLLRNVLIKCIREGRVPSKVELENHLFG